MDDVVGQDVLISLLVSCASVISALFALVGCVEICRRKAGFRDFENEEGFASANRSASSNATSVTSSHGFMMPPVESTPHHQPVVFEPLPDMGSLRPAPNNLKKLRPRIAAPENNRNLMNDSTHEKVTLQSLIINGRNHIQRSQLHYIKEHGSGWFGKVLQGDGSRILPGHKKTKVMILMLREEAGVAEQLDFLMEAAAYRHLEHPNVLKLLGQCVDTSPFLLVLELCPFGDLKTYLKSHSVAVESLNEKGLLLKFAADMAAGLQAMHQNNFIHRDFALRNCHLSSDLSVKVGDFGLAEETFPDDYHADKTGVSVPVRWLAPEVVVYEEGNVFVKQITKESNVWSYGVAFWEIAMFGALPYTDLTADHVIRLVTQERSLLLPKPSLPLSHVDRLYQLMLLCWSYGPHDRPSLRELRIMLLHLLSQKASSDSSDFERKWNQLMPKRLPQVVKAASTSTSVAANGAVPSGEYKQLDVSELGQQKPPASLSIADELGQSAQSATNLLQHGKRETTPANEMSLEAEFAALSPLPRNQSDVDISATESLDEFITSNTESQLHNNVPSPSASPVRDVERHYVTSTPRRVENLHATEATGESAETQGTFYATAATHHDLEESCPLSPLAPTSFEERTRSLMDDRKFANMLQTVALPSFEDEYTSLSGDLEQVDGGKTEQKRLEFLQEASGNRASNDVYKDTNGTCTAKETKWDVVENTGATDASDCQIIRDENLKDSGVESSAQNLTNRESFEDTQQS